MKVVFDESGFGMKLTTFILILMNPHLTHWSDDCGTSVDGVACKEKLVTGRNELAPHRVEQKTEMCERGEVNDCGIVQN